MDEAGDDLFAGAGLSFEEDGGIGGRDLLDALDDVAQAGPSADDGEFIILNGPTIELDGAGRYG